MTPREQAEQINAVGLHLQENGRPHQEHDTDASPPDGVHTLGIAARDRDHATEILSAWETNLADVEVEWLSDAPV